MSLRRAAGRQYGSHSYDAQEDDMGKVPSASMSLDGYIAKDDNTIGQLFD